MRSAFTLIELLVVITIIVVLLALLTPALDKAIYQAELTSCGATLKALSTGGLQYATAERRYYPTRVDAAGTPWQWDALLVRSGTMDLPKELAPYVGINNFLDPLGGKIDLSAGAPVTAGYANYQTYFGWGHTVAQQTKPLIKIGDHLEFTPPDPSYPNELRRFDVILADLDDRRLVGGAEFNPQCLSSHPDDEGLLFFFSQSNDVNKFVRGLPLITSVLTVSWWQGDSPPNQSNHLRGLTDLNYAYVDGSVNRLNKVAIDDPRCMKLPMTNMDEYNGSDRKAQLPRR